MCNNKTKIHGLIAIADAKSTSLSGNFRQCLFFSPLIFVKCPWQNWKKCPWLSKSARDKKYEILPVRNKIYPWHISIKTVRETLKVVVKISKICPWHKKKGRDKISPFCWIFCTLQCFFLPVKKKLPPVKIFSFAPVKSRSSPWKNLWNYPWKIISTGEKYW